MAWRKLEGVTRPRHFASDPLEQSRRIVRRVVTEPVGDGLQHSGELELLAFGDGASFHLHLPSSVAIRAASLPEIHGFRRLPGNATNHPVTAACCAGGQCGCAGKDSRIRPALVKHHGKIRHIFERPSITLAYVVYQQVGQVLH